MAEVDPVVVEGKAWALMGYLSFLCLVPLAMKRDNQFALFHAKQGLLLFLSSIVFSIVALVPVLGLIGIIGNVLVIILSIFGLFNALMGVYWKIPVLGNFAKAVEF